MTNRRSDMGGLSMMRGKALGFLCKAIAFGGTAIVQVVSCMGSSGWDWIIFRAALHSVALHLAFGSGETSILLDVGTKCRIYLIIYQMTTSGGLAKFKLISISLTISHGRQFPEACYVTRPLSQYARSFCSYRPACEAITYGTCLFLCRILSSHTF
jgi:hypothetical protein